MSAQLDIFGCGYVPTAPSSRPAPGSRLLDIIGLEEGEVLICTRQKTKDNMAEQRLLIKVGQMMKGWSLVNFTIALRDWMQHTSVGNHCNYWLFYKIVSNDEFAQIWHTNAEGDPDRHVCTITSPTPAQ